VLTTGECRNAIFELGLVPEAAMRSLRIGNNVTVFLLFFGIALLEATQAGHWPAVIFWLAIGALFLKADQLHR
jgi:hypothetical protein